MQKAPWAAYESARIKNTATTIFLVSGGYPDHYEKGKINYRTGTGKRKPCFSRRHPRARTTKVLTNGGRVLAMTSLAKDITAVHCANQDATPRLYSFEGKYYRRDIGKDLEGL
ncbi:MAG: phosphoribosylglycinamide synthetase C domain-containing protein [Dermatophilaceae bacterium]